MANTTTLQDEYDSLRNRLAGLPRYELWRLVEKFEGWSPSHQANDEYIKVSDLEAVLKWVQP